MLRNWKVWQKLAVIALAMGFMIPVLLFLLVQKRNEEIAFARQEIVGAEFLKPLRALFADLGRYRDLEVLAQAGDPAARTEGAAVAARIDAALGRLVAVDRQVGGALRSSPAVAAVQHDWEGLKARAPSQPAAASFTQSLELGAKLLQLIQDVGDASNLRFDPHRPSYYRGEEALLWSPVTVASLAEARGLGVAALARGRASAAEGARLAALAANVRAFQPAAARALAIGFADDPEGGRQVGAKAAEAAARIEAFLGLVEARVQSFGATPGAGLQGGARELLAAGNAALDARDAVTGTTLDLLQGDLERRVARGTFLRNLVLGATLVLVFPTIFLVLFINSLITRQVRSINAMFQRIDVGNYKARTQVLSRDELGTTARSLNQVIDNLESLLLTREERDRTQRNIMKLLDEISGLAEGDLTREAEVSADVTGAVADSFNYLAGQLRRVIGDVQETTEKVTRSAAEIQTTTERLAQGSESQSLRIVETSAAVDAIAASIQDVSASSTSANRVADEARANAEKGAAAVVRTIEGMNGIRQQVQETAKRIKRLGESSQEVGEIVQLIGDIADRTSILALNASIQAAMAGEAGRGFAVVAEEVERLAVRSADATKKIGSLIKTIQAETNDAVRAMEETTREVVSGSRLANAAGEALSEIEAVSNRLSELILSISQSATHQAQGSDSVARAMGGISVTTQHTAAGAKQVAQSIRDLAHLADELRASVSSFKLPALPA
jgi:twitching motility protein PilJ